MLSEGGRPNPSVFRPRSALSTQHSAIYPLAPIDATGQNSVGPWPAGFRGIGGHLLRRPPRPAPDEPAVVPADWLGTHAEFLLSPIAEVGGARSTACPVCLARAELPPEGGWLELRCASCGTDFVASDGSPPPVRARPPEPPAPAPGRHSPLAPPPADWSPLPDAARGFTSEVYADAADRRFVFCPHCRAAEVDIPDDAWVAVMLRCGACGGAFLVNLSNDPIPVAAAGAALPPVFDPSRKLWSRCPNCGAAALTPHRTSEDRALICTACGQRVVVSVGRRAPMLPPLPAQPSMWDRVRRWFGRD